MSSTATQNEAIYSSLGADPDLADIVEMFVDEMPGRVQEFSSRADSGDWDSLKTLAHQLKGAAGSYGFDTVTPFAAELENALKTGQSEAIIREYLVSLLDICSRLRVGAPGDQ